MIQSIGKKNIRLRHTTFPTMQLSAKGRSHLLRSGKTGGIQSQNNRG
jgi:hypothetical protein